MDIKKIANILNEKSKEFRIGELQTIRKEIKGLSKKASSKIFTDETISDDGWAFHYGGRKELQFNIGYEKEGLRYGVAFSLETSRTLPDLSILYPKVFRLNLIIREKPYLFKNYQMWYWKNKRSNIYDVKEIDANLIEPNTFIFIGKIMNTNSINYEEILKTFDDLLEIYIEVETNSNEVNINDTKNKKFVFKSGPTKLPKHSKYNTIEKEINIDVRHSYLQELLYNHLVELLGEERVGLENNVNGNRIDVVINTEGYITFFEIKTGNSAKSCIRQAFGQLMEYAYYDGQEYANSLIVVGEHPLDKETDTYLRFLNKRFNLDLRYINILEIIEKRKNIDINRF